MDTNTNAKFGIREGIQQFGVNCLPLLLKGLELTCDLNPPLKQLVSIEFCQVREWIWAFRG
jgi:hypothetical protein